MDTSSIPQKRCPKCGETKPVDEYPNRRNRPSGKHSRCRTCVDSYQSEYRDRHREESREYSRKYKKDHSKETQEYNKKYYDSNKKVLLENRRRDRLSQPDKYTKRFRKWYKENSDKSIKASNSWQKNNPIKVKSIKQRRAARKLNLPDNFTATDWERCLKYFGYKCAVCGRQQGLFHTIAMDHWIPLSSPDCPGTVPTNIVPLCHGIDGCNNKKNDSDPREWLIREVGSIRAKKILTRIDRYFASFRQGQ